MTTRDRLLVELLGTALSGVSLELLLLAGDELKLCEKLFLLTAGWVIEGEIGVFPEDGNIPDDVIAVRFLAWANAANPLLALTSGFKFPKGSPPTTESPKDGIICFVAVGNKGFCDVIESNDL